MTTEENRALAVHVYEAINARDLVALGKLFDPGIIRHAAGEIGIENAKNAATNTFTNLRCVVEDIVVEGDKVDWGQFG